LHQAPNTDNNDPKQKKIAHKLIGNWLSKNQDKRKNIFLGTKYGYCRLPGDPFAGPCSDPAYVPQALENALKDLQTTYIDLYYQHRVDPNVPIEIVLESLRPAIESGKVRYLGLSECSAETLRRAKAVKGVGDKLIAVQIEYSPFTIDVEKNGIADACKELGVSLVAYSPLARGLVSGRCVSCFIHPVHNFLIVT
jgi:aryl-alcohol dehydrogenase-like predicted oxidoreductase